MWVDGPRHAAYRQVLAPRLRGPALQRCRPIISNTVHTAVEALSARTQTSLVEWARKVALSIISQIILGCTDSLLLESFRAHVEGMLGSRGRTLASRYLRLQMPSADASPFFFCPRQKLDKMLLARVTSTVNASPSALAAVLTDDRSLGVLDDRELRNQVMSLLFAGYETTAAATAWTLYWLSRQDRVRRDVIDELTATSHDGSEATKVPLLHAVSQEALRLSPPAIVAGKRMLTADGELLGKSLSAGTIVTPCIYLAHHQSDLFPNPLRFDPDRFLGNRVPRRYYFPFGGGTRHCLGHELAMLEIRMITAAVLRYCELHCEDPEATVPVVRGPVLVPTRRLSLSLASRHSVPRNHST
ncbi:MAG: cytochrome P450 [Acidobacteria bacterium]|nr:cytochrome P450 [Acidobacteriota bacterium]